MLNKGAAKQLLGQLPLTAEAYWRFIQKGKPLNKRFSLHQLESQLPIWCKQAEAAKSLYKHVTPKSIILFGTLRYWIGHTTLLSITLAGMNHQITYIYLPYSNWQKRINSFDLRRQNIYTKNVFKATKPVITPISLIDLINDKQINTTTEKLPLALEEAIQRISLYDTQYTLQIEDVDQNNPKTESGALYQLRIERNTQAAQTMLNWLTKSHQESRPDLIILPNGSILEMGAIYQVAKYLQIPVVTYEFGEQSERIWFAQNAEVMQQNTNALWSAQKDNPFTNEQWSQIKDLYASRQNASLWKNFARLWQDTPSIGGEKIRETLNLDKRPVVLLAANVIGDSLTLGRQIFSSNMTEWLQKTIHWFKERDDVQLIIRVHPGERYTKGPSVADIIRPEINNNATHIHLIEADSPINTYDLIEISDLGLVYTTTVGMEMAMSGVPVVVSGNTHYRNKGFTLDPDSWDNYFNHINKALINPQSYVLTKSQIEDAWHYAYLFFFEFPLPFPWHLANYWNELEKWPIERVLSPEGNALFGKTFLYLTGEKRDWSLQINAQVQQSVN